MMPQAEEIARRELARGAAPADPARMERALLACLRSLPRDAFARLPDVSEGLENRLFAASRQAGTAEEFFRLARRSAIRWQGCAASPTAPCSACARSTPPACRLTFGFWASAQRPRPCSERQKEQENCRFAPIPLIFCTLTKQAELWLNWREKAAICTRSSAPSPRRAGRIFRTASSACERLPLIRFIWRVGWLVH